MVKLWLMAAAALMCVGAGFIAVPTAQATVCGSVGGRHVDISGCADPLSELNDALTPPPPPPPGSEPPPPQPAPNVSVCANVGRRVSVSACT